MTQKAAAWLSQNPSFSRKTGLLIHAADTETPAETLRCAPPPPPSPLAGAAWTRQRRPQNVEGEFFVDEGEKHLVNYFVIASSLRSLKVVELFVWLSDHRCIDCDTCRLMAPVNSSTSFFWFSFDSWDCIDHCDFIFVGKLSRGSMGKLLSLNNPASQMKGSRPFRWSHVIEIYWSWC